MGKTVEFNGDALSAQEAQIRELEKRFSAHAVSEDGKQAMEQVRELTKGLAEMLISLVPPGREQSLALTKLEEAVFWANAGIARS
jgi:hypothetical protein